MDAIQIVILTSIVNIVLDGIVVGIVIYVVQKKIDATVHKSMLEYETKFVATHSKKVETLQALYKKLALYSEEYCDLIMQTSSNIATLRKEPVTIAEYKQIEEKLRDFWIVFLENRLLLPDDVAEKVRTIHLTVKQLHYAARSNLAFPREIRHLDLVTSLRMDLSHYHTYSEEQWQGMDYVDLFDMLENDMRNQVRELENLYKSEADIAKE